MTTKLWLVFTIALLSATPALAQDPPALSDSRWNPYLGCWRIVQETAGAQQVPLASGTLVCVRPSGRYGVAITTTVDGKTVLEQTVVADGSAQPVSQGDCQGTQVSDWSRDGERLFTRVELECTGRPKRTVSGITLIAKGYWIDAQATVVDGDHDVRLRRFQRSGDQYTGGAASMGSPLTVEDVIEASKKVNAPALEAALDEAGGRFTLNSRVLRQLADADVSPHVIDLMVAQAYPDRFHVDRDIFPPAYTSARSSVSTGGNTTVIMGSSYPYPLYDPFYSSYYYYSPFAYPYYWGPGYRFRYGYPYYRNYYDYNYYGFSGGGYITAPGGGNAVAAPGSPDSRGTGQTVVTPRGYTRVRPNSGSDSSDSDNSGATRTRSTPGGTRGIRSGSDSSNSGSSSSSGGSISSGGYSRGDSGNSSSSSSSGGGGGGGEGGGRTAQPR
jgi:hypothetical protein